MSRGAYSATWVTDQLAVGAAPMSYEQLDCLRAEGIGAILNLCGEFCDLHDIECAAGFEVYHMPLADEEAPELAELEKALAWLDEAIYLGKKVLIHCRHGIGRTGTVLNAYLLRRGLGQAANAQIQTRQFFAVVDNQEIRKAKPEAHRARTVPGNAQGC
jgi:protein-tyrosine phosphatase